MLKNYNIKTENSLPILYFDGGSRGNPGEAAGAAVLVMPDGQKYTVSEYISVATNNEAEYTGLIVGLQKAKELGIEALTVKGDSQLVINQVNRKWKVNSARMQKFYQEVQGLIKSFEKVTLDWVPRHENHLADAAVNQCIDQGETRKTSVPTQDQEPKVAEKLSPVAQLIKLGKKANLKDYTRLKSGRDEFTSLGLLELKKRVPEEIQKQIDKEWDGNDKYLAKVYRWYLRGLPPEMAIHKVRIDADVEAKVTGKHPWLEDEKTISNSQGDVKKFESSFPYAKGDVIVISEPNNALKHQGVIVSEPKFSEEGSWMITIRVD
ncbi:ribonuclease HI family protein [Gloeothece verrucosa]|uniref:Ribonuclease H n=1 Tax=Gloeothece verrucosa (strain PCC 7822) TaxID=497965 RepID=E0UBJ3_GLOV7|nr:ribonuclease HI family protein [Gloeothece verrucosa]ADN12825.1 ribonuclease H [Gloeothece verrucosa PCC 7822]